MVVLAQVVVVAAVVMLVRWRRWRRRLERIASRFVEAVLDGDFDRADREAGCWLAAAPASQRARV